MKKLLFKSLFLVVALVLVQDLSAQNKEVEEMRKYQIDTGKVIITKPIFRRVSEEEISYLLDKQPSFGMYKDNYFITGFPTNKEISKYTADAKFQLSIKQRLTKAILPFNTFLMLTYTQKSFWNIYKTSSPFTDNNYNPGLAIMKPLILDNRLIGMGSFAFEHESNGKDSIDSRSWNYFVISCSYFFNTCFSFQAKAWAGWLCEENADLFDYRGYGLIAFNYRSLHDRIWISAIINPRKKLGNFNTQLEINLRLASKANQYLFVQWYNGYGESLLEYSQYTTMIRLGLCIKPLLRNLY